MNQEFLYFHLITLTNLKKNPFCITFSTKLNLIGQTLSEDCKHKSSEKYVEGRKNNKKIGRVI